MHDTTQTVTAGSHALDVTARQGKAADALLLRLAADVEEVDRALRAFFARKPDIASLTEGALFALGLDDAEAPRGKRLRPALALLVCDRLGGRRARALPLAVATELLHTFLLVHDDIQDGDRLRRGRPAVWVRYGVPHATNIGDYLFACAYEATLESGREGVSASELVRLVSLVTETMLHTGQGQALDLGAQSRRDLTTPDYEVIATEKTGHYLAAPMVAGAVVAGAAEEVLEALRRFGLVAGHLFQVADDLIDLTLAKGRGHISADLWAGKRSWPVVYTSSKCGAADRTRLFDILDLPRSEKTPQDVAWIMGLFERHNALAAGEFARLELMERAVAALEPVPEPLRSDLAALAHYMAYRSN